MKRRLAIVTGLTITAGLLLSACGAANTQPAEQDVQEIDEEEEPKAGVDIGSFSIKEMYAENTLEKILERHNGIMVECKNSQGDKTISDSVFQYYKTDDGDVKLEGKVVNGGIETLYEGLQSESYYMFYETSSKASAAIIINPDDYLDGIAQVGFINAYETYNYSDENKNEEDGKVILTAKLDDVGEGQYYVDSENGDLLAANYNFKSGVKCEYKISYDDFEKNIGAKVLDDNLESGMCYKLTVTYNDNGKTKDVDYNIAAGTDVALGGTLYYDLFTDEKCTDDSWVREVTVGEEDVHIYAKLVE